MINSNIGYIKKWQVLWNMIFRFMPYPSHYWECSWGKEHAQNSIRSEHHTLSFLLALQLVGATEITVHLMGLFVAALHSCEANFLLRPLNSLGVKWYPPGCLCHFVLWHLLETNGLNVFLTYNHDFQFINITWKCSCRFASKPCRNLCLHLTPYLVSIRNQTTPAVSWGLQCCGRCTEFQAVVLQGIWFGEVLLWFSSSVSLPSWAPFALSPSQPPESFFHTLSIHGFIT